MGLDPVLDAMDWADRIEDLLEPSEVVHERIGFAETTVVVTDRRVLAFTPTIEGANYRAIARPNVEGVARETVGPTAHVLRALRLAIAGVIALGSGLLFDFGAMIGGIDQPSLEGTGVGGALSMVNTMVALLDALDDALMIGGALALVLAAGFGAAYWVEREQYFVIGVAGDDDIRLPVPDAETRDRIERALRAPATTGSSDDDPEAPTDAADATS